MKTILLAMVCGLGLAAAPGENPASSLSQDQVRQVVRAVVDLAQLHTGEPLGMEELELPPVNWRALPPQRLRDFLVSQHVESDRIEAILKKNHLSYEEFDRRLAIVLTVSYALHSEPMKAELERGEKMLKILEGAKDPDRALVSDLRRSTEGLRNQLSRMDALLGRPEAAVVRELLSEVDGGIEKSLGAYAAALPVSHKRRQACLVEVDRDLRRALDGLALCSDAMELAAAYKALNGEVAANLRSLAEACGQEFVTSADLRSLYAEKPSCEYARRLADATKKLLRGAEEKARALPAQERPAP